MQNSETQSEMLNKAYKKMKATPQEKSKINEQLDRGELSSKSLRMHVAFSTYLIF